MSGTQHQLIDVNQADSLNNCFASALVFAPADFSDGGNGVGRKNRDSCEREDDMGFCPRSITGVQRTSRALPKQGAHMVQMSCV